MIELYNTTTNQTRKLLIALVFKGSVCLSSKRSMPGLTLDISLLGLESSVLSSSAPLSAPVMSLVVSLPSSYKEFLSQIWVLHLSQWWGRRHKTLLWHFPSRDIFCTYVCHPFIKIIITIPQSQTSWGQLYEFCTSTLPYLDPFHSIAQQTCLLHKLGFL